MELPPNSVEAGGADAKVRPPFDVKVGRIVLNQPELATKRCRQWNNQRPDLIGLTASTKAPGSRVTPTCTDKHQSTVAPVPDFRTQDLASEKLAIERTSPRSGRFLRGGSSDAPPCIPQAHLLIPRTVQIPCSA